MNNSDCVTLRVISQDGDEVVFKIKTTTPLNRLMRAYCERQCLKTSAVRFLYDGQQLLDDQTPADLKMEDGDYIDVVFLWSKA